MELDQAGAPKAGLRERKKQRTRETIVRVALQQFAERGYDHTTLAQIAEAADVSTRTIFSYFDSKEDILFYDDEAVHELVKHRLESRPAGTTTVDALREFVAELGPSDENAILRKHIVGANEELRLRERARSARIEQSIVDSIARDLGAPPDDLRPRLVAASMNAAFCTVRELFETESGQPVSHEQVMGIIDEVLEFMRGGLEALQRTSAHVS